MSLLRGTDGRFHLAWRLLIFLILTFALAFLLQGGLLELAGVGGVATGAVTFLAAVLAASWAVTEKIEGIPLAALGLPVDRLLARDVARGFVLGGVLMGSALVLLAAAGWLTFSAEPGGFPPGALAGSFLQLTAFLFVAALAEELLLRGYPLQALAERWGGAWAIGVTSVAFALLHAFNPGLGEELLEGPSLAGILPLVNIGLAGVVLGLAWWRTYSLWYATGVHLGWNWTMGFAADLPVSGLEPGTPGYALFETPGWDGVLQGPELWTGGAFGPEGGLAVTVASVAGIAWLARTERLSRALRVRALSPLPDRGDGKRRDRR